MIGRLVLAAAGLALVAAPSVRRSESAPMAPASVTAIRVPDAGFAPQAAVDADGGIHVVYFKGDPSHGDLFYARLDAAGHFSPSIRVNTHSGNARAAGAVRGAQLAVGRGGRVHVVWNTSEPTPGLPPRLPHVVYARMNDAHTGFEPEHNVVQAASAGLDGDTVAADAAGNVYVAWHAESPGEKAEGKRRVWITRSTDDGRTFGREQAASDIATGACECCGLRAYADRDGALYVLYRSAAEDVHRDTYLLTSHDHGATFSSRKLQDWTLSACPMSTFSLSGSAAGTLAAWETAGQVQWIAIANVAGSASNGIAPPGPAGHRKYPAVAGNALGHTLLAWTETTAASGTVIAWQIFNKTGRPADDAGRVASAPAGDVAAVAATRDGRFVVVY